VVSRFLHNEQFMFTEKVAGSIPALINFFCLLLRGFDFAFRVCLSRAQKVARISEGPDYFVCEIQRMNHDHCVKLLCISSPPPILGLGTHILACIGAKNTRVLDLQHQGHLAARLTQYSCNTWPEQSECFGLLSLGVRPCFTTNYIVV
jgi:hypothetical protein